MKQRLRLSSKRYSAPAGAAGEIVLFRAVETRFGRFYWNPNNAGFAALAGAAGGVFGLFAGAWMGLPLVSGLTSALLSLATSALCAVAFALNTLRA